MSTSTEAMLSGKALGSALAEAMKLKGVNQFVVAAEFGITQPSVSEWIRFGRIHKKHLRHLVSYFSDTVSPSHWGLPDNWVEGQDNSAGLSGALVACLRRASPAELLRAENMLRLHFGMPLLDAGTASAPAALRQKQRSAA